MESKPKPTAAPMFDVADLVTRLVKYLLEGLAVAIAAFVLPGKTLKYAEVGMIASSATSATEARSPQRSRSRAAAAVSVEDSSRLLAQLDVITRHVRSSAGESAKKLKRNTSSNSSPLASKMVSVRADCSSAGSCSLAA